MRVNKLRNVFCRMGVGRDNRTTWRILFIFVYLNSVKYKTVQGVNDGEVGSCRLVDQFHRQLSFV